MLEYALLTFGSLFAIVDPFAVIAPFAAMTERDTPARRRRMARLACLTCFGVLAGFAVLGLRIFRLLGITLKSFQIAGGLVLLLSALDMLQAKRSALKETPEELAEARDKESIAITPLAIPLLSGPGAITTSIVMAGKATGWVEKAVFLGCIALVSWLSYVVLTFAADGVKRVSPTLLNVMGRLMGLLLAAVGVQLILAALRLA